MGYAIHARDGQWPPNPPVDGEPIAWHYRASEEECEDGEVYLEDMPEGMSQPRWDAASGEPRFRTDEEIAGDERRSTLERVAGQAEASLSSAFVNPNDVLGLVASALYRVRENIPLEPEEEQALAGLNQMYERAVEKKAEIAEADPKDLGSIGWEDDGA